MSIRILHRFADVQSYYVESSLLKTAFVQIAVSSQFAIDDNRVLRDHARTLIHEDEERTLQGNIHKSQAMNSEVDREC